MKRRFTLIAILVIGAIATAQTARTQRRTPAARRSAPPPTQVRETPEQDKLAIKYLHDADIKASLAYDVDALSALWTDDIVAIPPNHAPITGRVANLEFLRAGEKEMDRMEVLGYSEDWQEVNVLGDTAVEWGTISGRLRPIEAGAKEIEYKYNVMRVLKKQPDGAWLVARSIWNDANLPATPPTPPAAPAPEKMPR
ncbi:MAG TPA: nuclear transport factor 2 family protein [Terriglobales bacterium]|nr:nuclear transport factor 2 family protein [Terriglobales bacterium]